MKEESDTLIVRGTTAQAFETMINFVYHKDINWHGKSAGELFEIVNIAELYDVVGFITAVEEAFRSFVNLGNVMDCLHHADKFKPLFRSVSERLFHSCISFIVDTLRIRVLDFSGLPCSADQADNVRSLHETILEIPLTNCELCKDRFVWAHREDHWHGNDSDSDLL